MKKKTLSIIISSAAIVAMLAGCSLPKLPGGGKTPGPEISTEAKQDPPTTTEADPDDVDITPTENADIEWVDFTTAEGFITGKIPEGWVVESGDYAPGDDLSFYVKVYDPNCPERMVYFAPTVTAYQSQEAVDLADRFDTSGLDWSTCPINSAGTTSSLFANSGRFWGYSDYNEIADLGENGWGGNILQATVSYNGKTCEGLFTSGTMYPLGNNMNYFGVNISPTAEYGTTIMMAPEEEFPSWQPVLTEIFDSITMTDTYQQARAAAWQRVIGTSQQLAAVADYTSDLIMSGWESRNNTYDILSQRTSDATMGRDRVYDTETGEVYYTDLGWYDSYYGSRFEYVGEGSSYYNLPVTGTIE